MQLSIMVSKNNKVALEKATLLNYKHSFGLVSAPELITKNTSDCEKQTFGGY